MVEMDTPTPEDDVKEGQHEVPSRYDIRKEGVKKTLQRISQGLPKEKTQVVKMSRAEVVSKQQYVT